MLSVATEKKLKFEKEDLGIIVSIVLLFILIAIPGIDWGAPSFWNPDEIVQFVSITSKEDIAYNQRNVTYPDLPLFILSFIAKIVSWLGKGDYASLVVSRYFSVSLGLLILIITYIFVTRLTSNRWIGLYSSLFIITNNEYLINSRFAHNDIYLMFFSMLSIYSLIYFQFSKNKVYLFLSFFLIGLAAGSKYNGGALILAPIILYAIQMPNFHWKSIKYYTSTFLWGGVMGILGYAIGNPTIFSKPFDYIRRVSISLKNHAQYAVEPGDITGALGQWNVLFERTFGELFFTFSIISFLFLSIRMLQHKKNIRIWDNRKYNSLLVIFVSIIAYDIPISISYNYPSRFFLLLVPVMAIVTSIFLDEIFLLFRTNKNLSNIFIIIIIGLLSYSSLESISMVLNFKNDSRILASNYLYKINNSYDKSIEYTLYPPTISRERFLSIYNYPLILIKYENQELPTHPYLIYNSGEQGIETRRPDILVIDSLSINRFDNTYNCNLHKADCMFFKDLFNSNTNYELTTSFIYMPPSIFPNVIVEFANPDIYIFERLADN